MLTLVRGRFAEAEELLRAVEALRWFIAEFVLLPALCAALVFAATGRAGWAVAFLFGAALSPMLTRVAVRCWPRKR